MSRYDELLPLVRSRFEAAGKSRRFRHVEGVVDTAAALAAKYGADVEGARLAALLHDVVKYEDRASLRRRIDRRYGPAEADRWPEQLWHGLAAVEYAESELGIRDPDVLAAIENHSAGRPGMSTLEKIVFVADYVEPHRDFDNAAIRAACFENLDRGVALVLRETNRILEHTGWNRAERGDAAWAEYRHLLEDNE